MNWKTFLALLSRDARVARRNFVPLLLQTFLQPMMFVFIFGRVMVSSGYMPSSYKSLLLPGIMAISMIFTGVWAVAMPLIAEFQFTHEIEDRLLAPIGNDWLAIEKVLFGAVQAVIAGTRSDTSSMVVVTARGGVEPALTFNFRRCYLAGSASVGVRRPRAWMQRRSDSDRIDVQHGADPDDFLGCTYYPWSALASFPTSESRAGQSACVCK